MTLDEAIEIYYDDPVAFCEDILEVYPDKWQSRVLMDLAKNPRVSVRSGQGVGKTGLESWAVLWFLTCRPYAKVIATAPTMQQLFDVLWAEIAKWMNQSLIKEMLKWTKTKVYMVGDEERWFATARTATKPENMQGFHEDHMLFIVDEASGVADPILEAILGTLSGLENKILMCGNPNKLEGIFYDSHNDDAHRWKTHKVSSMDSSRTSKENIEMLLEKYGAESDVARVRVFGEFPKGALDGFISRETVVQATESSIPNVEIYRATVADIGVDVARFGDDKTVLIPQIANKALKIQRHHKQDTMETVGHVVLMAKWLFKSYPNLRKIRIKVDDSGVGGGVTDRLNEIRREDNLKIEVIPVNNGESATDEHYENLGTQAWGELRELLEANMKSFLSGGRPLIQMPDDKEMTRELSNRKYRISSRAKIQLERKDEMKKRGVQSPDTADAMVLAFYKPKPKTTPIAKTVKRPDMIN